MGRLTSYQIRRQIRERLRDARHADKDVSPERMRKGAEVINRELEELGMKDYRVATWGKSGGGK